MYLDFNIKSNNIFKLLDEKVKNANCRKILETLANSHEFSINESK